MNELNPGIKKLVKILNENGFKTTDSGDGKTHDFGCDRSNAYVCIEVQGLRRSEDEAVRLMDFMRFKCDIDIYPIGIDGAPCIQATYDPANGTAFIELMHVDDSMLEKA